MFLEKYINDAYLNIVYDNYNRDYLESLDENNFIGVYNLLRLHNCYFIDDIILNYLELFEIEPKYINHALLETRKELGDKYIFEIGNNLTILDKVISLAHEYEN